MSDLIAPVTPALPVSRRASSMPRSAIREIMALAAGRADVIHLEVGEPDFSTPDPIIDAAFAAAHAGWTKYSSNAGLPRLRQQVADRVSKAWGRRIEAERVVITTGAVGALYSSVMTLVDAGDEVLIPDPGWPNYESIVHLAGAHAVRFSQPAERQFLPDPEQIARQITPRSKAIVINTPSNPTGAVFPASLMHDLAAMARRTGLNVISDEIYEDVLFDGAHHSMGVCDVDDRAFIVSGFSKSFAMTGWRVGWVICPPGLAPIATALQEPITSCASTISQKAAEAALDGDQHCVGQFRAAFERRRDILVDVFGNTGLLPMVPQGAFYGLIDISSTGMNSLAFAKDLLMQCNTAVVPGSTFGPSCERYVRVAFTIDDDGLRLGLERLRGHIEHLSRR